MNNDLTDVLYEVLTYPEAHPEVKTVDDFFDYASVPPNHRSDFAFAAILNSLSSIMRKQDEKEEKERPFPIHQ